MNPRVSSLVVCTLMALSAVASPTAGWTQAAVSAGYDLFTTDPDTTDLLGIPFVGDTGAKPTFDFVPPPDSADGRRAIGDTDTIVHRQDDAFVETVPGTADPITIELVLLRLVSTVEFDVDGDGSSDGRVFVTLQKDRDPAGETRTDFDQQAPPEDPPSPDPPGPLEEVVLPGLRSFGQMTITFASAQGGTFESQLLVFADLRLGSAEGPIVCGVNAGLPACADLDAGLALDTTSAAVWSRNPLPEAITIRGINYSLAAPDRNDPVDTSLDFRAGIDPFTSTTICVAHGGHPDPQGLPTAHGTCRTVCRTSAIALNSCKNGVDDDCNGTIDDCDEDLFGPNVTAPADRTLECAKPQVDFGPNVTGFATGTDNCFPPELPAGSISSSDFMTPQCGPTFDVDRIWTARDNCGNDAAMPDLQQIFVVDTTDPGITCPMEETILWTHDRGPDALGYATGTDTCSEDTAVGIGFGDVPVLGACLSEDVTRTWTATDECGNDTPCDQLIFVRGPKDAIEDLAAVLAGLNVEQRFKDNLSRILDTAVSRVCDDNVTAVVNQLQMFNRQVGREMGRKVSDEDAVTLVSQATAIKEAIEIGGACPAGCAPPTTTPPTTIIIGGCDTGVADILLADGRTLAEGIGDCDQNATNRGRFVSCVNDILNDLLQNDVISNDERQAIEACL